MPEQIVDVRLTAVANPSVIANNVRRSWSARIRPSVPENAAKIETKSGSGLNEQGSNGVPEERTRERERRI